MYKNLPPIIRIALIVVAVLLAGVVVNGLVYLLREALSIVGSLLGLALQWALYGFIGYQIYKRFRKPKPIPEPEQVIPDEAIRLDTTGKPIVIGNPFRGIFVIGAAGSGKSESIAVPLLSEFIRNGFCGLVYDFKFPTLANDIQSFIEADRGGMRHFYIDLNNPLCSPRINPIQPGYLPNTSYAREFACAGCCCQPH